MSSAIDPFVLITGPEQLAPWAGSGLLWPFRPEDLVTHQPDAHWLGLNSDGCPTARCSLWWQQTPFFSGHRVGLIGQYAAADFSAARALLDYACNQLQQHGCTLAIGPMDGNTWRRYRLVTDPGTRPAFFLEPSHPADWA